MRLVIGAWSLAIARIPMNNSQSFIPIKHRVHRKRRAKTNETLMLVSVAWDDEAGVLSLQFDRAISITHLNPDAIRLKEGNLGVILGPYPPVLVQDQTTLTMSVTDIEP